MNWFTRHRWPILGAAVVAYLLRQVFDYWQAGALSTPSFVILGATVAFELGCLWYLLRGFRLYRTDPRVVAMRDIQEAALEFERRRKRFG